MTINYTYVVNSTNYNPATTTFHFRVVSRGAGGGGTAGNVANDFDVSSGTQACTGNTTDIVLGVKEQTGTQGTRNFTLEVADNAGFTGKVTLDFQVVDGAAAASPTYEIQGSDPLTVLESDPAQTITVNTTNVSDGTFLYWNITTDAPGTTQASTDWQAYNSGGTGFEITSNSGTFDIDATADAFTDGSTETFYLHVRTGSDTGTSVDSIQLNVTDDSQTPALNFAFSPTDMTNRYRSQVSGGNVTSTVTLFRNGDASAVNTVFDPGGSATTDPTDSVSPSVTANEWTDAANHTTTFGDNYQIQVNVYENSTKAARLAGNSTRSSDFPNSPANVGSYDTVFLIKGSTVLNGNEAGVTNVQWEQDDTSPAWFQMNEDIQIQMKCDVVNIISGSQSTQQSGYIEFIIKEYSGTLGTGTTVLTAGFDFDLQARND